MFIFDLQLNVFSKNIVWKSKKSLMSKVKIRLLRFFQFVTQISIWFLNDDYFNAWNFSSIFLYLMIKNCNIFLMKTNINFEIMYDLIEARIVSFILSILWMILTICFFLSLVLFHTRSIIFLLSSRQFMKIFRETRLWSLHRLNNLICNKIFSNCWKCKSRRFDSKMRNLEKNFFSRFCDLIIRVYIFSYLDLQS
jgi:hypothetical protein